MKYQITSDERSYLLWLDGGMPGDARKLPQRLVELALVKVIAGEPGMTSAGVEYAKIRRNRNDHGHVAD